MKRFTFFTICLLWGFSLLQAQSYIGFLSDNYSGVNAVVSNPANIKNSIYKVDINLTSASAYGSNDYFGVNVFDALKDEYSFDLESIKSPTNDNRASGNIDVLGPSFMFNLNANSTIAFFTRGRLFVNVNEINGATIMSIDDDTITDYSINEENFNAVANAWAEFGVSYARTIFSNNQNELNGGFSIKYLKGLGSAYAFGKDVNFTYDADGTDLGGGENTGSISSSGALNFARFDEFDSDNYDYKSPESASGFGLDLGLTYLWNPNNFSDTNGNDYKIKIGLSITDIGFINYKNGTRELYNISNSAVSEDDFNNAESIDNLLNSFYTRIEGSNGYKVDLPTAVHFNLDWNLNSKLFLNFNTNVSVMSKNRVTANRIVNMASLTPRYESKWFSFYLPLSVMERNGLRIGAGFRAGPLYAGSGSLISAFASDNNQQADVYAGFKIPIYRNTPKDKDEDGIVDKNDECPEAFGPEDNNGCPWGDKDEDGILDNEDACPEEVGPIENKGCPWKDTDGDGVLDKDDSCIEVAGTIPNKGCPEKEVTEEVQKILNAFATTILFDSGTSQIKVESNTALLEIVEILKQYPSSGFTIEGHTDSTGGDDLNRELSELRANAVKDFLVKNGIDANRLLTVGYGERKPIFSNKTRYGRSRNRRVEINLID